MFPWLIISFMARDLWSKFDEMVLFCEWQQTFSKPCCWWFESELFDGLYSNFTTIE